METVGDRVASARVVAGLSRRGLAKAILSSTSTISRIERGLRNPSLGMLHRIAFALNVKVSQLTTPRKL
jgi:transcriptional regulator with XRE-family HTH domain